MLCEHKEQEFLILDLTPFFAPKLIAASQPLSAVPTLVIGLQSEVDAWLAAKQLPARPDEINKKGTAQAWTLARADGASLAIVSAKDAASLEALIRPLPHYGGGRAILRLMAGKRLRKGFGRCRCGR